MVRLKKLKLFNGRPYGVLPSSMIPRAGEELPYLYIAAYSVIDARRVCREVGFRDPGTYEINTYWHKGHWGTAMDGITPERGLWLQKGYNQKPERIK